MNIIYKFFVKALLPFRVAMRFEISRELLPLREYLNAIKKDIDQLKWHHQSTNAKQNLALELQSQATLTTARFVQKNMYYSIALNTKHELIDHALELANNSANSIALEFGVYSGESINYIAKKWRGKVYGFDSFEGLPKDWRSGFGKGTFAVDSMPKTPKNVKLVKGLFENTIDDFLKLLTHSDSLSFIHIDCDLYESTKTIFEKLCKNISPGCLLLFDEYFNYPGWQNGEHLAFIEYTKNKNISYEYIAYNQKHEQVLVKILNS